MGSVGVEEKAEAPSWWQQVRGVFLRIARETVNGESNRAPVPRHTKPDSTDDPGDNYLDRLAKLIPGEVTAAFLLINRAASDYVLAGAIALTFCVPLYLKFTSRNRKPDTARPKWFTYILATIAFPIWALAISTNLANTVSAPAQLVTLLLVVATLALPAIDLLLYGIFPRRQSKVNEPIPSRMP